MILGDLKVIRDTSTDVLEIYNLKKDRRERRNLYDKLRKRGEAMVRKLDSFFADHEVRMPGYAIPHRH